MAQIYKIILFLLKVSRNVNFSRVAIGFALITGLLSGIGYTSLVAIINNALTADRGPRLLYAFIALCVLVPINRFVSQALFNSIGARAIFEMRLQLSRGILNSPLRNLEAIGPHRLFASLTDDVQAITTALVQIPALSMHLAIVLAGLCYMTWLSPMLLLLVLGGMVVGVLSYNLPLAKARIYNRHLREHTDALFGQFRGLVDGAKELRLHRKRRIAFFDSGLVPTGDAIRRYTFLGNTTFTGAAVWGNLVFMIIVGVLAFAGTRWADLKVLSGYTLTLLYMMTPLEVIMQSFPLLSRAATATDKLERLGLELTHKSERLEQTAELETSWKQLELADVAYSYEGEEGKGFGIGPLNLTFQRGELVFLVGGNGSGKTTFAKILTGLYSPQSGEIRLDGSRVTDENRDSYRQLFSAVFSDFYLFESLLGLEEGEKDLDTRARGYLEHLELDSKVKVEKGVLSTVNLSQGQRKRLALLTAYLEDRPIYFFDEWAADQDPHYKEIFYFEVLPELKARGKTVFVISHDDQYYGLGDRLIKLNYGKVERDELCANDGPVSLKVRRARA
jgi:putative ATP-binding cassette transporter